MATKQMDLVWNEHLSNMREEYSLLYEDNLLTDVSLSCQGGFLRAHKLVLTACSPYFKQVFQENPCKHPTIIMRSVNYHDMSKLLDYIYKGQMSVSPPRLDNIVKVASELRIKGFEEYTTLNNNGNENDGRSKKSPNRTDFEVQKENIVIKIEEEVINNIQSTVSSSTLDKKAAIEITKPTKNSSQENDSLSNSENEEDDEYEDQFLKRLDYEPVVNTIVTLFECELCNRRFKSKKDLQKHKKIHQDKSFTCEFCDKRFSRASHLIRHRRVHTGERPFICDTCGKDFARQDKLKLHIRTNHNDISNTSSSTNFRINVPNTKKIAEVVSNDEIESDVEMNEHITLENISSSNLADLNCSNKEKRGRGRPRKYPLTPIVKETPKRGRGRPRKEDHERATNSEGNYDITSLPYGDISYLTMPLQLEQSGQPDMEQRDQIMPIEPLVEISTDTTMEADIPVNRKCNIDVKESSTENVNNPDAKSADELLKTIGKIGECTISFNM